MGKGTDRHSQVVVKVLTTPTQNVVVSWEAPSPLPLCLCKVTFIGHSFGLQKFSGMNATYLISIYPAPSLHLILYEGPVLGVQNRFESWSCLCMSLGWACCCICEGLQWRSVEVPGTRLGRARYFRSVAVGSQPQLPCEGIAIFKFSIAQFLTLGLHFPASPQQGCMF